MEQPQTIHEHNSNHHQRAKALKALEKAKALEARKMKNGAKYIKIDDKTEVLRYDGNNNQRANKSHTRITSRKDKE